MKKPGATTTRESEEGVEIRPYRKTTRSVIRLERKTIWSEIRPTWKKRRPWADRPGPTWKRAESAEIVQPSREPTEPEPDRPRPLWTRVKLAQLEVEAYEPQHTVGSGEREAKEAR